MILNPPHRPRMSDSGNGYPPGRAYETGDCIADIPFTIRDHFHPPRNLDFLCHWLLSKLKIIFNHHEHQGKDNRNG